MSEPHLPHAPLNVPWIAIGGLPIAVVDRRELARRMIDAAFAGRGRNRPPPVLTSANGQVISLCARDRAVRELFLAADLIHADGMPLVMASRWLSATPLPERVATTDLFHDVAREAQARGARFYFLGAAPEIVARTAAAVRRAYPGLDICGARDGYFDLDACDDVIAAINRAAPDVLWVGMGVPREQAFAQRYRDRLTGVGLIKTSGGMFDFLSGKNRRAPAWMQRLSLEWFHRLWLEPRRLFLRYLSTNPHALYLLAARRGTLRDLPAHWRIRSLPPPASPPATA